MIICRRDLSPQSFLLRAFAIHLYTHSIIFIGYYACTLSVHKVECILDNKYTCNRYSVTTIVAKLPPYNI